MVVKDKLKTLYQLQQVDLKLDGLLEERGDLPAEVDELEKKITLLKTQIKENDDYLKKAVVRKKEIDKELDDVRKRIDKYTDMRIKVKTNREYDALSKQIDNLKEKLQELHKELENIQSKEVVSSRDVDKLKQEYEEEEKVYSSKKVELEELVSLTHDEEKRYVKEREKFAQKIDKQTISRYEMIRKATKGKAIVPVVRRNACGGCYNVLPPQRLLDLRQMEKFFTCDHCGRILVPNEIVEETARDV
ncbi:MAG: C4-type zinc ribbon domain-containing protein [Bacteroidetes bacterium]|nr:C4-type zinc ribbon domain-containing protein [Bacteroidota bacterium]MCL5738095.1 C4-type zinc ribbon domain-containing protein [Bacteroidota bacterium]